MNSTPEEKLLDLIRKGHSKARLGKDLKIFRKINIVLIGIILLVTAIFLADIFNKNNISEIQAPDAQIEKPKAQPVAGESAEEDIPDISAVSKGVNARRVPRQEIMANLNLLGIIKGDNNQAIIEDKSLKKTFFLYKGDSVGDLKVYDIKDNVVILDYNGQKIELRM